MKLAEALTERADLSRRLQDFRERILRNAKHQEGDQPAEDPKVLLKEYEKTATLFTALVVQINQTNNSITLEDGVSMIEALAQRDILKMNHSLHKALAIAATPKQDRYSKSEIRYVSSVTIAEVQKLADQSAHEYRVLDLKVQQANWSHELVKK